MSLPARTQAVTDFSAFAGLKSSARAQDPSALKKAAQQFESLMTQQLLKSARAASLSSDDVLGGGQTSYYQDLFDQQMALHLSTQGRGLGLADVLVRQVTGMTHGASPVAGAAASAPAAPAVATSPNRARAASGTMAGSAFGGGDDSTSAQQDFIAAIRPQAEKAARALGVPTHVILAQAAVETGWGRHVPKNADGSTSFNLFGIKATSSWTGSSVDQTTHEHLGGRLQKVTASFKTYGSVGEAFDDYVKTLQSNPRYADALRNGATADGFAAGLQKAGYATDPAYAGKLLRVAQGRTMTAALSPSSAATTLLA